MLFTVIQGVKFLDWEGLKRQGFTGGFRMKLISVMISRNQVVFCRVFCILNADRFHLFHSFQVTENIAENYLISRNHNRNQFHSKSPCKPLQFLTPPIQELNSLNDRNDIFQGNKLGFCFCFCSSKCLPCIYSPELEMRKLLLRSSDKNLESCWNFFSFWSTIVARKQHSCNATSLG